MKTIVVPFDFSTNATHALAYALQLSAVTYSPVLVFHVLHESPYRLASATTPAEMDELIRFDEQEKIRELDKAIGELLPTLPVKINRELISSKVQYHALIVEKTIEVAQAAEAGLIVMGTHGASGIRKWLFGSNTANMVARCPIPVLAIPEQYAYKPISRLLYASDLENLETELNTLIPFAIRLHAVIDVLHLDYGEHEKKISTDTAERVLRNLPYQFIMLHTVTADLNKSLMKQLNQSVQSMQPEWLVMFTRGRNFWDRIFSGSRTEDMVQALPVPILSMKKPGASTT
ncbi:MAG: universal stress protein [Chitinophagales bacterium]|nr:universal stress protein [Chitinophagales bacterium]